MRQSKKSIPGMSNFHFACHILDASPNQGDFRGYLNSCGVWDLDGDGVEEIFIGGEKGLFWYRYPDGTQHIIDDTLYYQVGMAANDLTSTGKLNLVVATWPDDPPPIRPHLGCGIVWFETPQGLNGPWIRHIIERNREGAAHDLLFADINNDGRMELLASSTEGHNISWYEVPNDPRESPWPRHIINTYVLSEGLAVCDINGNGRLDIISGPYWYEQPEDLFHGEWKAHAIAEDFRGSCRVQVGDVYKNGIPTILLSECEYVNCKWGLFSTNNKGKSWKCRTFEDKILYFAHTAHLIDIDDDGDLDIVIGEMPQGGWDAPKNPLPKTILYENLDGKGQLWERHVLNIGSGTHEGKIGDVDGDGHLEIICKPWPSPAELYVLKRITGDKSLSSYYEYILIDNKKQAPSLTLVVADLDGDGTDDVLIGNQWYHAPKWGKYQFPFIGQVLTVFDVDGDGRLDVIGTKATNEPGFTNQLYWLKAPQDPLHGEWIPHFIGVGNGDWPESAVMIAGLPEKKHLLVIGYHNAGEGHWPQTWEIPDDPTKPWIPSTLAPINYGSDFAVADIDRDGLPELIAGPYILDWQDGKWSVLTFIDITKYPHISQVRVADMNGNGRLDVIVTEKNIIEGTYVIGGLGKIAWFEAPENPYCEPWIEHVVAVRWSPYSLDVTTIGKNNEPVIIVGEYNISMLCNPLGYSKLIVFKRLDPEGIVWTEHVVDLNFEHFKGAQVIHINDDFGIVSHGLYQNNYVHLWKKSRTRDK